jgi:hypothetical protein
MWIICPACSWYVKYRFVCEFVDEHGRRWEMYECPRCEHRAQYAVG